jgi:hypothetical protein
MEENRLLDRHAEDKRATIATVNLLVVSALHGVFVFTGFSQRVLPLTVWMVILGIYGIVSSLKLYERSQYHMLRARKFRSRLHDLYPGAQVESLLHLVEEEHKVRYPFLKKVRLNTIWVGLHSVIVALGILYTVLSLMR